MSLLIQTGFLTECVNYIDERWRSKGQVGKLEQYGYGYLLSQMANTPAVISRLDRSGFIEYMVDQLWSELEYVTDDLLSVFPRRFPSEPISRHALKVIPFASQFSFMKLRRLFSSHCWVFSPSFRPSQQLMNCYQMRTMPFQQHIVTMTLPNRVVFS